MKELERESVKISDNQFKLLWRFLRESFKFMIFGFFKRCIIINDILQNIKKQSPNDTREYFFNEALAHDLGFFFKTILKLIERGSDKRTELIKIPEYYDIVLYIVKN